MAWNSELAHRALRFIEKNPEDWNQGSWNACFATIVVELGTNQVITDESNVGYNACVLLGINPHAMSTDPMFTDEENQHAHPLFLACKTLSDLKGLVEQYDKEALLGMG